MNFVYNLDNAGRMAIVTTRNKTTGPIQASVPSRLNSSKQMMLQISGQSVTWNRDKTREANYDTDLDSKEGAHQCNGERAEMGNDEGKLKLTLKQQAKYLQMLSDYSTVPDLGGSELEQMLFTAYTVMTTDKALRIQKFADMTEVLAHLTAYIKGARTYGGKVKETVEASAEELQHLMTDGEGTTEIARLWDMNTDEGLLTNEKEHVLVNENNEISLSKNGPWHSLDRNEERSTLAGEYILKKQQTVEGIHGEWILLESVTEGNMGHEVSIRNPLRTLLDVDPSMNKEEYGKRLVQLVLANWIQKGRLVFKNKNTMLRNWTGKDVTLTGRYALRLCGRGVFPLKAMELVYSRRGGEANPSGTLILETLIGMQGRASVYPLFMNTNIAEDLCEVVASNERLQHLHLVCDHNDDVVWSWLLIFMWGGIVEVCDRPIEKNGSGRWWKLKALITASDNNLYETEEYMKGKQWVHPFIENPAPEDWRVTLTEVSGTESKEPQTTQLRGIVGGKPQCASTFWRGKEGMLQDWGVNWNQCRYKHVTASHVLTRRNEVELKVQKHYEQHMLKHSQTAVTPTARSKTWQPKLCKGTEKCNDAILNGGGHESQAGGRNQPARVIYWKHVHPHEFFMEYLEASIDMYAKILNLDEGEKKHIVIHIFDMPTGTSSAVVSFNILRAKVGFQGASYTIDWEEYHVTPDGVVLPDLIADLKQVNYVEVIRHLAAKENQIPGLILLVQSLSCVTSSKMKRMNAKHNPRTITEMNPVIVVEKIRNIWKMRDSQNRFRWSTVKVIGDTKLSDLKNGHYRMLDTKDGTGGGNPTARLRRMEDDGRALEELIITVENPTMDNHRGGPDGSTPIAGGMGKDARAEDKLKKQAFDQTEQAVSKGMDGTLFKDLGDRVGKSGWEGGIGEKMRCAIKESVEAESYNKGDHGTEIKKCTNTDGDKETSKQYTTTIETPRGASQEGTDTRVISPEQEQQNNVYCDKTLLTKISTTPKYEWRENANFLVKRGEEIRQLVVVGQRQRLRERNIGLTTIVCEVEYDIVWTKTLDREWMNSRGRTGV